MILQMGRHSLQSDRQLVRYLDNTQTFKFSQHPKRCSIISNPTLLVIVFVFLLMALYVAVAGVAAIHCPAAARIIQRNSWKSISPSPFSSTSLMAASSYSWVYISLNSLPARSQRSSYQSILPLPSVSNIWKAVLRQDSRRNIVASMVAAKNSAIQIGQSHNRQNVTK